MNNYPQNVLKQKKQNISNITNFNKISQNNYDQNVQIRSKSIGLQKRKLNNQDFNQNRISLMNKPVTLKIEQQIYNKKQNFHLNNFMKNQIQEQSILIGCGQISQFSQKNPMQSKLKKFIQFKQDILLLNSNIINFSTGQKHICYVNKENKFYYKNLDKEFKNNQIIINDFFNQTQNNLNRKNSKFKKLFSTPFCTFVLNQYDQLYGFGLNDKGQLGINPLGIINNPKKIHNMSFITQFQKRQNQNINYRNRSASKGKINSMYYNQQSNLLPENSQSKVKITQGVNISKLYENQNIIDIVGGPFHTLILTNLGRVFYSGVLYTSFSIEKDQFISTFTQIKISQKQISQEKTFIRKVSSSLTSIGFLTKKGRLYLMGLFGQDIFLDYPTDLQCLVQQEGGIKDFAIMGDLIYLIDYKGKLYQLNMSKKVPKIISKMNQICNQSSSNLSMNNNQSFIVQKFFSTFDHIIFKVLKINKFGKQSFSQIILYGIGSNEKGQLIPNRKDIVQLDKIYKLKYLTQILNLKTLQIQDIKCSNNVSLILLKGKYNQLKSLKEKVNNLNIQTDNQLQQLAVNPFDLKNIMKKLKQLQKQNQFLKNTIAQKEIQKKFQNFGNSKNQNSKSIRIQTQSNDVNCQNSKLNFQFKANQKQKLVPRMFQNSLEIDFNQINLGKKIAQGGYGIIYKAQWKKCQVAVKIFKIDQNNLNAIKDFVSQCYAMEALRHPNIVMFLGACVKSPHFAIVLQLCEGGTLWSLLQNRKIDLNWIQRINLALDLAKAMNYLHQRPKPIVHRDLKSLNILLDSNRKVKLADFGWTKGLQNYMTSKIGTYQWMAPEVVSSQQYTEKADVFSYAIILWQIASRQPPYRNIQGIQVAYDVVNKDLRPPIPNNIPAGFQNIMVKCWSKQPENRPTFRQIIEKLQIQKNNLKQI